MTCLINFPSLLMIYHLHFVTTNNTWTQVKIESDANVDRIYSTTH